MRGQKTVRGLCSGSAILLPSLPLYTMRGATKWTWSKISLQDWALKGPLRCGQTPSRCEFVYSGELCPECPAFSSAHEAAFQVQTKTKEKAPSKPGGGERDGVENFQVIPRAGRKFPTLGIFPVPPVSVDPIHLSLKMGTIFFSERLFARRKGVRMG
eukprot:Hpha_TRINITY_DN17304_c0_g1::TRINITY_DN17304_c0_g1_i1::g.137975::m.137975